MNNMDDSGTATELNNSVRMNAARQMMASSAMAEKERRFYVSSIVAVMSVIATVPVSGWLGAPPGVSAVLGGLFALNIGNAYECYLLRRRLDKMLELMGYTY